MIATILRRTVHLPPGKRRGGAHGKPPPCLPGTEVTGADPGSDVLAPGPNGAWREVCGAGGSPSTESRLAAPETYRSDAENSYPLHWKPSEMHGRPPEVHRQTPLAHGKPSRPHC